MTVRELLEKLGGIDDLDREVFIETTSSYFRATAVFEIPDRDSSISWVVIRNSAGRYAN